MPCCLMTESSTSLDEATCMINGHKLYKTVPEKINANTLHPCKNPALFHAIQLDLIGHAGVLEYLLIKFIIVP